MEYLAHLKRLADLEEGKEVVLTIRDLSPGRNKYLARVARVKVSRTPEALARWDTLWAHSAVGFKDPRPWGVKIVEELGLTVPGQPYSDIYRSLAKM
ncbi:MAG: hypothetical protein Q8P24_04150 [Desulfobacterales bacterium]|nr:hypothetical protein [Desulfobacterales bacterium]